MKKRMESLVVAAILIVFTFATQSSAQADTFGSGSNTFTIDFVNIGNAGNVADTNGYGSVPYEYRVSTYEITQDAITKAAVANVTADAWTGSQPAANISWYEAAAFVNWLNTSMGKQAAYDLTWDGSAWSMSLWSSENAWTAGGTNLYRHKDAYYFLSSENEWYKAAYYNAAGSNYFLYPTASDTIPSSVASGTNANTAVYQQPFEQGPAEVDITGGLSPYGTMGQGGNVFEWMETAFDGSNTNSESDRALRGGGWVNSGSFMLSGARDSDVPSYEGVVVGFRVASVPEPSSYALLLMTGAGVLWWARRRR